MNKLAQINSMGIVPMPKLEQKTLDTFIKNNESLVKGMNKKEVYETFKNTASFGVTRIGYALSSLYVFGSSVEDMAKG